MVLTVPSVPRPEVSIVVVTYQGAEYVETALRALVEQTEPCYELTLIDNGSTDGTAALVREVKNATIVLNKRNEGFGVANNDGATHARGRYVVFLNQDAFVHEGWLPPLLERIKSDDRIGAVGPMLLNTDGSLQCAGAMVFRRGETACFGEGDDPNRPEYRSPRDVDYLAGACLLVRRDAFNEVGGFDPAYGLAYFEDVDLGLALSARGYRVVYEPRSVATHVRGEPGPQLLDLARQNHARFRKRWRAELSSRLQFPMAEGIGQTPQAPSSPRVDTLVT